MQTNINLYKKIFDNNRNGDYTIHRLDFCFYANFLLVLFLRHKQLMLFIEFSVFLLSKVCVCQILFF